MMNDDVLRDAVATAISSAPFPSGASRAKAERVLSTLRASGRLAPAVEGDVVEAAVAAGWAELERWAAQGGNGFESIYLGAEWPEGTRTVDGPFNMVKLVQAVTPIIAAATEARAREECGAICDEWLAQFSDKEIEFTTAREYATDAVKDIAELIRTGAPR
jgi:hypothetical protein